MADTLNDPRTGRPIQIDVPAPGPMDINPQAIQRLFETQKLEDAQKALSMAIQFQGVRGYQEALKSGEPAEKALTRYGPMMFYQRPSAFGPAVRAVTPPTITPYQQQILDERSRRSSQPHVRSIPGGGFVSINPTNQAVTTIREPTESSSGSPSKFNAVVDFDRMRNPIRLPMTGDQFRNFMETAPPRLQTNSVNTTISRMLQPPSTSATGTNASAKTKRLRYNPKTGEFEQ